MRQGNYLTTRDREIVTLICQGWNLRNVSIVLHLTEDTVKSHVKHLRARFGARTQAHLVSMLYQRGLLLNPKRDNEKE